MEFYKRAQQYIKDVVSGKELTCIYVKQAVERHIKDLKNQGPKRGIWFDEKGAKLYLEFVKLLKFTKGVEFANKPFDLQPFQCFIFMLLFGWKRYDDRGNKLPYRRFTRVYEETAKKSGKSEKCAALIWICALLDGEYGAQYYSVATKRDQARYVFNAAKSMAKNLRKDSRTLHRMIKLVQHRIYVEETESYIEALSSDYNGIDGLDPHIGIVDEYHAHKTSLVADSMKNAQVARLQPILYLITTAGFNLHAPCYTVSRDEAVKVLNGTLKDDSLLAIIFTLDKKDDWKNPKVWYKANPNLGKTVKLSNMLNLFKTALAGGPLAEVDFKTKNLNIWVASHDNPISDEIFMRCKGKVDLVDQRERGVMCWGGTDFGQTSDMTCQAFLFDPEMNDGKYIFVLFTWLCEDTCNKRIEQGEPHAQWVHDGFLEITPGDTTDYNYLKNRVLSWNKDYPVVNIGYDKSNATQTAAELTNEGIIMDPFYQGINNMNNPTREFIELFIKGAIVHDGNSVMRWMIGNIALQRDADGRVKITKKDPKRKVDGAVAMVMALGQYMEWKGIYGSSQASEIRVI